MTNKKNVDKIIEMKNLSWKQIEDLEKDKTIFFLPISPLEEHGPHLPVGTDYLTSIDTVNEAIKILNKKKPKLTYIKIPAIPLGFCKFNQDFPGSISVDGKTIQNIVYSIGSSLARHEFKYMIISSYHMALAHLRGIYSAMKKLRSKYDMRIYEPWGPYFYNNLVEEKEPDLDFDTEKEVHAGFRETSLMKYQYPYLVDRSHKDLQSIYRNLNSPRVLGKTFKKLGLKQGYVGSPSRADPDYGRWFFNETVNTIVDSTIKLYEGKKLLDLPKNVKRKMKLLFWQ
ncbi:MAG: creatininase family protein [Candidatus Thermoplasmatota archaeon]